jgi:thiosulfate/3-mercaptopyruvate sulfurtransferase
MTLRDPAAIAYPTPLVDVAWLAAHLDHPGMVIVDCQFALSDPHQGKRDYQRGHIPGAYHLDLNQDLSSPIQSHGGRHPLPDWAVLKAALERCGIGSDPAAYVVAYDNAQGAFAARLWWLLRYLGHEAVAVLDGGLASWQAADYPLSQAIPAPTTAHFVPQPQPDWIVDIAGVKAQKDKPGTLLIDSRAPERFRGEVEPIDPIAGSIPGAVNYFWKAVLDDQGRMRSPAELAHYWAALENAERRIVYCGSGVTACVNLLSQAVAGYPLAKLYVGGWSDWCSYLV